MKVLLIYFSGTGHTARCAEAISASFKAHGHEVVSFRYMKGEPLPYDVNDFDLLGFGYPIHAFNLPEAFHRFLCALPAAAKDFFVFKVSGEPFHFNDSSSYHMVRKMKKKGYRLIAEKHFLMPYNIMFRYRDGLTKQMALYLPALSEAFVQGILNDKPETIPYHWYHKVLSFLLRIEWIAPKVNAPLVRFSKKKCIQCQKCVRDCPGGAIEFLGDGKFKVRAGKCTMCMRCTMECPKDAISFGIMNPWKVNGSYPFEKLLNDPEVDAHFVHEGMKGYFKNFLPYFRRADALLKEYGIPNPLD